MWLLSQEQPAASRIFLTTGICKCRLTEGDQALGLAMGTG